MQNPPPSQQGYGSSYGTPPPHAPLSPQPGGTGGKTSMGLDANVAGALAYIATWLTGLIFFLIEKENRFVRFHAMQAILFGAALVVASIALSILFGILGYISTILGLFGLIVWPIFFLLFLVGWIMCMVKAYQGQMFKLPIIGDMAQNIVNK